MESTSKRLRFCLDHDEVPSMPYALSVLGLIGHSTEVVLRRMNDCARRSIHQLPARACLLIGPVVEKWHMSVVRLLLEKTPFTLDDRKASFDATGGCRDILDPTRTFLVEGHLNARYTTNDLDQRQLVIYNILEECERENSWRYVVALKGGRLYAPDLSPNGIPISNMWLNEDGRPDQQHGFMKRILKVYEVGRRTTGVQG